MNRSDHPHFNPWLALVVVCFGQFMVVLDATIVNVALPSIQHGLGFAPADLQWVINAYTLVFGGFLLLGGRAADLVGRKRLFMAGIAVFTLASLVNGLAQSSDLLLTHVDGMRQSVAGVNIDEEVTNLNAAQHAYNAAARVISTIDEMLDTLINHTGVG